MYSGQTDSKSSDNNLHFDPKKTWIGWTYYNFSAPVRVGIVACKFVQAANPIGAAALVVQTAAMPIAQWTENETLIKSTYAVTTVASIAAAPVSFVTTTAVGYIGNAVINYAYKNSETLQNSAVAKEILSLASVAKDEGAVLAGRKAEAYFGPELYSWIKSFHSKAEDSHTQPSSQSNSPVAGKSKSQPTPDQDLDQVAGKSESQPTPDQDLDQARENLEQAEKISMEAKLQLDQAQQAKEKSDNKLLNMVGGMKERKDGATSDLLVGKTGKFSYRDSKGTKHKASYQFGFATEATNNLNSAQQQYNSASDNFNTAEQAYHAAVRAAAERAAAERAAAEHAAAIARAAAERAAAEYAATERAATERAATERAATERAAAERAAAERAAAERAAAERAAAERAAAERVAAERVAAERAAAERVAAERVAAERAAAERAAAERAAAERVAAERAAAEAQVEAERAEMMHPISVSQNQAGRLRQRGFFSVLNPAIIEHNYLTAAKFGNLERLSEILNTRPRQVNPACQKFRALKLALSNSHDEAAVLIYKHISRKDKKQMPMGLKENINQAIVRVELSASQTARATL